MNFQYIKTLILSLIIITNISGSDLPNGFEMLPAKVQNILLNSNDNLTSLQCRIKQKITQATNTEYREGYYWALADGRFRVDYIRPKETIVFDKKTLYWKIDQNKFVWVIDASSFQQNGVKTATINNALAETKSSISQFYSIKIVEHSWYQFWASDNIVSLYAQKKCEHKKDCISWILDVDLVLKKIVRRQTLDGYNRTVLDEIYTNSISAHNDIFFKNVRVIAKDYKSKLVVTSETEYIFPLFNLKLPENLFMPPLGQQKKYEIQR